MTCQLYVEWKLFIFLNVQKYWSLYLISLFDKQGKSRPLTAPTYFSCLSGFLPSRSTGYKVDFRLRCAGASTCAVRPRKVAVLCTRFSLASIDSAFFVFDCDSSGVQRIFFPFFILLFHTTLSEKSDIEDDLNWKENIFLWRNLR